MPKQTPTQKLKAALQKVALLEGKLKTEEASHLSIMIANKELQGKCLDLKSENEKIKHEIKVLDANLAGTNDRLRVQDNKIQRLQLENDKLLNQVNTLDREHVREDTQLRKEILVLKSKIDGIKLGVNMSIAALK